MPTPGGASPVIAATFEVVAGWESGQGRPEPGEPNRAPARHTGMSSFEIDVVAVDATAAGLDAAANAVDATARTVGGLRLTPAQAGAPDGETVSRAVAAFAERCSRTIQDAEHGLRGDAEHVRVSCRRYGEVDRAFAGRLSGIR